MDFGRAEYLSVSDYSSPQRTHCLPWLDVDDMELVRVLYEYAVEESRLTLSGAGVMVRCGMTISFGLVDPLAAERSQDKGLVLLSSGKDMLWILGVDG